MKWQQLKQKLVYKVQVNSSACSSLPILFRECFYYLLRIPRQLKKYYFRLSSCDLCNENLFFEEHSHSLEQALVCPFCLQNLPLFKQEVINGNLLMWPAIHRGLPHIAFDHLFALSPYLPPFNQWLSQLKYQGRFEIASFFAALLANQWRESYKGSKADVILSVPLSIKKWQQRGYNQAHLIANPFAEKLQLKYLANAVVRIKDNESQMGKTGSQRRKNLKNAFKLNDDFTDINHVILLDDVVTTGTTASEISRLLKLAGVKTVTLVTVCLTLPKT